MTTASRKPHGFPGDEDYDPGEPEAVAAAGEMDPELEKLLGLGLAKGWLPQPGDKVGGTVVDRYIGSSEYGDYPILELEQADGSVIAVHGFHTVLKGLIERKDPKLGDRAGVVYYGPQDHAKKGSPAEMYRLVVIPRPVPVPAA